MHRRRARHHRGGPAATAITPIAIRASTPSRRIEVAFLVAELLKAERIAAGRPARVDAAE